MQVVTHDRKVVKGGPSNRTLPACSLNKNSVLAAAMSFPLYRSASTRRGLPDPS
jgi:hypothetical protein